jgi:hypothetical protein
MAYRRRRASSAARHDYGALTPLEQFELFELLSIIEPRPGTGRPARSLTVWETLRLEELLGKAGDLPG